MIAIETKELTKVYISSFRRARKMGLDRLNLPVQKNEIFGFLGLNGAGKTTAIKLLCGLIKPTSGTATILNIPITEIDSRAEIGFLPENPYFYEYLTPWESLDFYGRMSRIPDKERNIRIESLLELMQLDHVKHIHNREFSKGMRQRLGLAIALINDPTVLILDEPMSGLDPLGRRRVREVILQLKDQGKTVFFSSHILADVEMICDRVGILSEGRLISEGALDALLDPEIRGIEIIVQDKQELDAGSLPCRPVKVWTSEKGTHIRVATEPESHQTIQHIVSQGGRIYSVIPHRESLEEYFLRKRPTGEPTE